MTEPPTPRRPLPRSRFAGELARFPETIVMPDRAAQNAGLWARIFRDRIGPGFSGRITLEIGCFDAEFLCHAAAAHPHRGFIGLDWKARAIVSGAQRRIQALNLPNILLLRERAQDILHLFVAHELDQLWLFHPDPCAAEDERDQRLFSAPFLSGAHQVLAGSTSRLVLKTDHAEYARFALSLLDQPEVTTLWNCCFYAADFWNDAPARAAAEAGGYAGPPTFFERRFLQKNNPIHLLEISPR